MLHRRQGMEGVEERRHGDFTGAQGELPERTGGDDAGAQRQQSGQQCG